MVGVKVAECVQPATEGVWAGGQVQGWPGAPTLRREPVPWGIENGGDDGPGERGGRGPRQGVRGTPQDIGTAGQSWLWAGKAWAGGRGVGGGGWPGMAVGGPLCSWPSRCTEATSSLGVLTSLGLSLSSSGGHAPYLGLAPVGQAGRRPARSGGGRRGGSRSWTCRVRQRPWGSSMRGGVGVPWSGGALGTILQ